MPEKCAFPFCKSISVGSEYCIGHKKMMGSEKVKQQKSLIAKQSEKRKSDQKEYRKIVKEMLSKDASCKVRSPVCTKKAQGLHHKQKRSPGNLTDKSKLIPSCNPCNLYIENYPEWAKEKGFTISRFKKKVDDS